MKSSFPPYPMVGKALDAIKMNEGQGRISIPYSIWPFPSTMLNQDLDVSEAPLCLPTTLSPLSLRMTRVSPRFMSHVLKSVEKIEVKDISKVKTQIEQHYEFLSKTHMLDPGHNSKHAYPLLQHVNKN